jgi:hypothetical protein
MLRLLLLFLIFYLLWKMVKSRNLRRPKPNNLKPKKPRTNLNIDKSQIEDAKFREIKEEPEKEPKN